MPAREVWRSSAAGKFVRQAGAGRVAISALLIVLALLFARYSWSPGIPLAVDVERALYDTRVLLTSPRVDEDKRVVLVVYDEETLAQTGKRSPLDRVILAKALRNLDAMGARGIGVDILIDQAQPEDPQLIAVLRQMRTPVKLAFSSNAETGAYIQPWQEAFMRQFQRAVAAGNVRPATIRIEADPDGVMRSWPKRPPGLPPLLAEALAPDYAAFSGYDRSLLYRVPREKDREVFGKFAIQLFADPALAEAFRSQVEGRYVMIGGVISDLDQFDTPMTRIKYDDENPAKTGTTSGLEIHATMLAQLLDHRLPRPIGPTWLWLAAIGVVLMGAGVGAVDLQPWRMAFALAASAILLLAVPLVLQRANYDTQDLPVFGWIGGWLLALVAVGSAVRAASSNERKFAQGALGKYLPRDIAKAIIADPEQLTLKGERREIYALFTDMEGFTKLTTQLEPEQIATVLNRYLDMLSSVVLAHGGTLDKFVGDAVVAFWGAPIARADDADRAIGAAIAMYEAGERFRRDVEPGMPPIGRTRVGVHRGEAIVGNLGGEGRIQYTALGDGMNAAARLEGANKSLKTTILLSREAVAESTFECFRPMGRVTVRGRSTPIEVFEAVPACTPEEIARMTSALAYFERGDPDGLARLRRIAEERPEDLALASLVERLERAGAGGSYALD